MIITRTPFRVTLGGGGTDLPSYYREHGGFVFAMGIDKYMYIMVNPPIVDDMVRLHYTRSETVPHIDELEHELAREALRYHGIENRMEISSMADLPEGTGLGSSGAYLVGLLTALHHYRRDYVPLQSVAEEACEIELDILSKTVGKQDQYMATFGGLTVLDIDRDGGVEVRSVDLPSGTLDALTANTHLYYTGVRRSAVEILRHQSTALDGGNGASDASTRPATPADPAAATEPAAGSESEAGEDAGRPDPAGISDTEVVDSMHRIKELGHRILDAIESEDFDDWGRLLHEHWENKKRLSKKISLGHVDELYAHVRDEFGVLGGKIAGAGGGGFLMLYCPGDHRKLERFMAEQGMPRLHYDVEHEGAKVLADLKTAPAIRRSPLGSPAH